MVVSNSKVINACYQCGKCTASCPLRKVSLFSPRIIAQDFILDEKVNEKIWKCLTCDLCSSRCPMGITFSDFVLEQRIKSFQKGTSQAEEAHFGYFSMINRIMANKNIIPNRHESIPKNIKIAKTGEILYFMGCVPFFTNEPHMVEVGVDYSINTYSALKILNHLGITPAVLENEKCCGHDSLWIGDVNTFKNLAQYNIEAIENVGAKLVIFNCAEGYRTFKIDYPQQIRKYNFEVISLAEFLLKKIENGEYYFPGDFPRKITYHDPCRMGRHLGIYEAPRKVLEAIPGVELIEMENNKEDAQCCGVNSWINCDVETKALRELRLTEAEETGANILVTTCPKCQMHFNCLKFDYKNEPGGKQSKIQIEDFATFIAKAMFLV
ncbi:MAG: (Fe-S)-binding protein [Candidatus Helarchaeota archaeon]